MPKPIVDSVTPAFARLSMIFRISSWRVRADVRVAVGAHDHARDRAGPQGLHRLLVREVDARAPSRSSRRRAGRSIAARICRLCVDAGRRQHEPRVAGVRDERDRVLVRQVVGQDVQRLLRERSLSGESIEPETSTRNTRLRRLALARRLLLRRDADAQHVAVRLERRRRRVHHDRERRGLRRRRREAVLEVVDPLLDAHRLRPAAAAPSCSLRRAIVYDAVSTSAANVDR